MPRYARYCPPGIPQHIIQRGNNHQSCFLAKVDFATYINCLKEASRKRLVQIHAWVLMTNHVHLLATPQSFEGISEMMQDIGRKYVRYFNTANERSGTLWEGRFKSSLVDSENHLLNCYRYIELNPVRASMVNDPDEYTWSSYQCNGLGHQSDLIGFHPLYLALGATEQERLLVYRELCDQPLAEDIIADIRKSINQGLVLGSKSFKDKVESVLRARARSGKCGRPARNKKKRDQKKSK